MENYAAGENFAIYVFIAWTRNTNLCVNCGPPLIWGSYEKSIYFLPYPGSLMCTMLAPNWGPLHNKGYRFFYISFCALYLQFDSFKGIILCPGPSPGAGALGCSLLPKASIRPWLLDKYPHSTAPHQYLHRSLVTHHEQESQLLEAWHPHFEVCWVADGCERERRWEEERLKSTWLFRPGH